MANPDQPRNRRRKEARPAEIIAAALDEFTARGFAATRLEEVARRAGVSKGTLYLYFPTKEDLFKEMVRQTVLPMVIPLDRLLTEAEETADTATLLRVILTRLATVLGSSPAGRLPKVIISEANAFPDIAAFWLTEVAGRAADLLQRVINRGVARGEFSPGPPEPLLLVSPFLLLSLWNTALAPIAGRSFDPETYAQQATTLLLNGLCVRPAPAGAPS